MVSRLTYNQVDWMSKRETERSEKADNARKFEDFLRGSDRSKGCCSPCNYHVIMNDGKYRPCKMGHEDAGPNKEVCADCSFSHYHPKR